MENKRVVQTLKNSIDHANQPELLGYSMSPTCLGTA